MADFIDVRAEEAARGDGGIQYSVGTLMRDSAQYEAMKATFLAAGFSGDDCEYLHIDNCGDDQWDAYRGLNAILNRARGRYVILCHQDVRLIADKRSVLDARLKELSALDPLWAVAGNSGAFGLGFKKLATRITDPHGPNQSRNGPFPRKVMSLDENFMIVRRDRRVAFSGNLQSFHCYGADICLNADILGYSSYVIDFHLEHLSGGTLSRAFDYAAQAFVNKWCLAIRPRALQTTCTFMRIEAPPSTMLPQKT